MDLPMSIERRRSKVSAGESDDEDKIGYGKPPKHSQYKPGQSGYPRGRSKGARGFKTLVMKTLKAPVKVTSEGKSRKVTTIEAMLLRLREKGVVGGDHRSLALLLHLAETYCEYELAAAVSLSVEDSDVLRIYNARLLSGAATKSESIESNDASSRASGPDASGNADTDTPKTEDR
jgi:hypothetical protein